MGPWYKKIPHATSDPIAFIVDFTIEKIQVQLYVNWEWFAFVSVKTDQTTERTWNVYV